MLDDTPAALQLYSVVQRHVLSTCTVGFCHFQCQLDFLVYTVKLTQQATSSAPRLASTCRNHTAVPSFTRNTHVRAVPSAGRYEGGRVAHETSIFAHDMSLGVQSKYMIHTVSKHDDGISLAQHQY